MTLGPLYKYFGLDACVTVPSVETRTSLPISKSQLDQYLFELGRKCLSALPESDDGASPSSEKQSFLAYIANQAVLKTKQKVDTEYRGCQFKRLQDVSLGFSLTANECDFSTLLAACEQYGSQVVQLTLGRITSVPSVEGFVSIFERCPDLLDTLEIVELENFSLTTLSDLKFLCQLVKLKCVTLNETQLALLPWSLIPPWDRNELKMRDNLYQLNGQRLIELIAFLKPKKEVSCVIA